MNTSTDVDDIDRKLPVGKTLTLGLQHVLVMYAGAVTVPLIVGGALRLSTDHLAALINADLLCCGIVSLIQALGLGKLVGIRLPVMMGVSYAGIGPMIAVGLMPGMGLPGLYGAIIAAGVFGFLLVPVVIRLLWLFPPLVTGTTLTSLGVGLLGVAIAWAGGGYDVPDFGNPVYLAVAALVLAVTLLVARFARGFSATSRCWRALPPAWPRQWRWARCRSTGCTKRRGSRWSGRSSSAGPRSSRVRSRRWCWW